MRWLHPETTCQKITYKIPFVRKTLVLAHLALLEETYGLKARFFRNNFNNQNDNHFIRRHRSLVDRYNRLKPWFFKKKEYRV